MTFETATGRTAAAEQLAKHNEAHAVLRKVYTPAAGTNYAVVGCVMADAFDPATDEAALIAALQAKPEITSVANPRLYGQAEPDIDVNPGTTLVTLAADATQNDTVLAVDPLKHVLPVGTALDFGGGATCTVSTEGAAGARSLEVSAIAAAASAGGYSVSAISADDPTHEWVVYATVRGGWERGSGGDTYSETVAKSERIKPPDGKKWIVLFLVVPSALDPAGRIALEAAIESVTGITTCEHLLDGTVPADALGTITLQAEVHMRIDTIPIIP